MGREGEWGIIIKCLLRRRLIPGNLFITSVDETDKMEGLNYKIIFDSIVPLKFAILNNNTKLC